MYHQITKSQEGEVVMFCRMFGIIFLVFFAVSGVPIVTFAQDGGSSSSVSQQQTQILAVSITGIIENDPDTIQSLLEAGLSDAEISEVRSNVLAPSASTGEYAQAHSNMTHWYLRQCDIGQRSWIVFNIGPGGLGTLTTYQQFSNLTTIVVDKIENACPADAICGFISWAQRPGLAPLFWGIRYNGPILALYSWCSG